MNNDLRQKNLGLFFTYGMSLEKWKKYGMYDRELALYKLIAKKLGKVFLFTYGDEDTGFVVDLAKYGIVVCHKKKHVPNIIYSLILPFAYRREMKSIDIIKTNQMMGVWTAIIAKCVYRKPLITRTGYTYSRFAYLKKKYIKYIFGKIIECLASFFSDKIVVATKIEKQYYPTWVYKKITIIPNYVDTSLFKPDISKNNDKKEKKLLCIGRLTKQKNLFNLIEAVGIVDNVTLQIIGQGELKEQLIEFAKEKNVHVEFLGAKPHEELPKYINQADIFILPSFYEGNPKVLLEAMACGALVIGTDVEGIRKIILDSNAILSGINVKQLCVAINNLLLYNNVVKQQISKNMRNFIINNFSLEHVIKLEIKNIVYILS
ncbi:MAG: glycosyltransferase family 4 protein [Candidatus Magasanikbacteria bacterium]|jgi:glycosyltransferase involved in cell wall biosynthesis|nr:glycosyltransferase family 4 protein [Candidatus Magasanikbacteria bacterium]MBT4071544.1 glycosyltransferase family 4 protein [Candidatus Magasanikbacteria bacterium]